MANRYMHQQNFSPLKGVTRLFGVISIGASGAPTISTALKSGRYINSIARNAAGEYTITLDDKYYELINFHVVQEYANNQDLNFQVLAEDVDGAKTIKFACKSAAAAVVTDGVAEDGTITFEAVADITDEEFVVLTDSYGLEWGFAFDKTGSSAAPSDALWTAIPAARKAQIDVSGDTTAANVAASVKAGMNALVGFSSRFLLDDVAADGTCKIYYAGKGVITALASYLDDGAQSAGGVTYAADTSGTAPSVAAGVSTSTDPTQNSKLRISIVLKDSMA